MSAGLTNAEQLREAARGFGDRAANHAGECHEAIQQLSDQGDPISFETARAAAAAQLAAGTLIVTALLDGFADVVEALEALRPCQLCKGRGEIEIVGEPAVCPACRG